MGDLGNEAERFRNEARIVSECGYFGNEASMVKG